MKKLFTIAILLLLLPQAFASFPSMSAGIISAAQAFSVGQAEKQTTELQLNFESPMNEASLKTIAESIQISIKNNKNSELEVTFVPYTEKSFSLSDGKLSTNLPFGFYKISSEYLETPYAEIKELGIVTLEVTLSKKGKALLGEDDSTDTPGTTTLDSYTTEFKALEEAEFDKSKGDFIYEFTKTFLNLGEVEFFYRFREDSSLGYKYVAYRASVKGEMLTKCTEQYKAELKENKRNITPEFSTSLGFDLQVNIEAKENEPMYTDFVSAIGDDEKMQQLIRDRIIAKCQEIVDGDIKDQSEKPGSGDGILTLVFSYENTPVSDAGLERIKSSIEIENVKNEEVDLTVVSALNSSLKINLADDSYTITSEYFDDFKIVLPQDDDYLVNLNSTPEKCDFVLKVADEKTFSDLSILEANKEKVVVKDSDSELVDRDKVNVLSANTYSGRTGFFYVFDFTNVDSGSKYKFTHSIDLTEDYIITNTQYPEENCLLEVEKDGGKCTFYKNCEN